MPQNHKKMTPSADQDTTDQLRRMAMALIRSQKTMVLATNLDNQPWAAPVYYIYFEQGFYFYSSPRSLHIRHIRNSIATAASIHADGNSLEQLEGIQMSGRVKQIDKPLQKLSITARYLIKFPLAKPFLHGIKSAGPDLRASADLFVFVPDKLFYMNHKMGFGSRTAIDLVPPNQQGETT